LDNSANELFEFIRFTAQMPYSEQELKEKPLNEFFDIVRRANEKIELMNKAAGK
jgi:hypothetical protein